MPRRSGFGAGGKRPSSGTARKTPKDKGISRQRLVESVMNRYWRIKANQISKREAKFIKLVQLEALKKSTEKGMIELVSLARKIWEKQVTTLWSLAGVSEARSHDSKLMVRAAREMVDSLRELGLVRKISVGKKGSVVHVSAHYRIISQPATNAEINRLAAEIKARKIREA